MKCSREDVSDFEDEVDSVYRQLMEQCLKTDRERVVEDISVLTGYGGVGLMPVEWFLSWSTQSAKDFIFADSLMRERLSGLSVIQKEKYHDGLMGFVKMMCELESIRLHVAFIPYIRRLVALVNNRIESSMAAFEVIVKEFDGRNLGVDAVMLKG